MSDQSYNSGRSDQDLTGKARDMGNDLRNKASELTEQFTEKTQEQASEIGSMAKRLASDAAARAQSAIAEQKSLGAQYVASVAGALHRAAGEVNEELPFAAKYLHQTADQIDSAAQTVRDRDMRELVGEVESFARRQPALFFGGAMLLGFAALRFLKSAPEGGSTKNSSGETPNVRSPSISQLEDDMPRRTQEGA
jgi:hypothetical protein